MIEKNNWLGEAGPHDCCEAVRFTVAHDKDGWYLNEDYRKGEYIKFCPFCGERLPSPSNGGNS